MTQRDSGALLIVGALVVGLVSALQAAPAEPSLRDVAEHYFRGVYGCDPAVVEELAAPDVVATYPVFASLYGKPALRGRDEVTAFAEHFCRKWADARFVFEDAVSDDQRVVLLWSFSARDTEAGADAARTTWGGISLFRFNAAGRITAEIGEESSPGPMGRLGTTESK